MKQFIYVLLFFSLSFAQKPSKLPLLKSLVIPGWGNYSLGDKSTAYVHFGVEAISWIGYFYNDIKLANAEKEFKSYANLKLTLGNNSYSSEYYSIIARYNNYEQYVEYQTRQGNNLDRLLDESLSWDWGDETNRTAYVLKRKESIDLDRKFKYFFATMGVNRLISLLTTQKMRKKLKIKTALLETAEKGQQFQLSFNYLF